MSVMIGVDPHKATHTAVAIDRSEAELARARVRATRKQVPQLLRWAEPLGQRTSAVESAGGLGYLLSQQLVAAGETVLDVPSTLARGSVCLAPGGRTRTIRTTRCLSRSQRCGRRRCGRSSPWSTPKCSVCWRSATSTSEPSHPRRVPPPQPADGARSGGIARNSTLLTLSRSWTAWPRRRRRRPLVVTRPSTCWPMCSASTNSSRHRTGGSEPPSPRRDDAHRAVRCRTDHRVLPDRVHRRHRPLRRSRRLRRVQRHRPVEDPPVAGSCTGCPSEATGA